MFRLPKSASLRLVPTARRTSVLVALAISALLAASLTHAYAASPTLTATLSSKRTIQVTGAGFPASATVRMTYAFGGVVTERQTTSDTSGAFADEAPVPASFSGIALVTARAKKPSSIPILPGTSTGASATAAAPPLGNAPSTATSATGGVAATGAAASTGSATGPTYSIACSTASTSSTATATSAAGATELASPEAIESTSFPSGAVINFPRGCTWKTRFTVNASNVTLQASGDASQPAPILTSSGPGENRDAAMVTLKGNNIVVDGLHLREIASTAIASTGTQNTIKNLTIDNAGVGVWFYGDGGVADNVAVSDLHMVNATEGGDDDYGAVGFNIQANNITIQNSSCTNCIAPSPDYGTDGGFVEIWKTGNGLKVLNNTATNTNGFFEAGGQGGSDAASGVVIEGNIINETNGTGIYLHTSGTFTINMGQVQFNNNSITQKADKFDISGPVVGTGNTLNGKALAVGGG